MMLSMLLLVIGSNAVWADCQEDIEKLEITPAPIRYWTRRYRTTTIKILNSTMTCSGLSAEQYASFNFVDKAYDQILKITNSNFSTVPPSLLSRFTTIVAAHLDHLHIERLQPGAFNGLTRLRELHLNHNELTTITTGIFNSLHLLLILNLANNKIQRFEEKSFMGVTGLQQLLLSNNVIVKLPEDFLEAQDQLQHLDLSGNPLVEFQDFNFTNIKVLLFNNTRLPTFDVDLRKLTLTELNLSSTRIVHINFSALPKLQVLDLSNNEGLALENWENLNSFEVIVSNNNIQTIGEISSNVSKLCVSHNNVKKVEGSRNVIKMLLELDLSYNLITSLEENSFAGLRNLIRLSLKHNRIFTIKSGSFSDLLELKFLDLSNNVLENLRYGTFDTLINLQSLNIANNKLRELPVISLGRLIRLDFTNNKITKIDPDALIPHLPMLVTISLDKNLFACGDLPNILHTFRKIKITIVGSTSSSVENFQGIACINQKEVISNLSETAPESMNDSQSKVGKSSEQNFLDAAKLTRFLNEDFEKSQFYKFFDQNYAKSNFFQYLQNFPNSIVTTQDVNVSKADHLMALEREKNPAVNVVVVVLLAIVVCLLAAIIYLMVNLIKIVYQNKRDRSLQVELI